MSQRKLIICVDDEKMVLDSLQTMLARNFGNRFELEFAESAEEAIEIIDDLVKYHELYVVVTDWLMPDMKGDEFLCEVKSKYPKIKTIMLSGQADPASVHKAIENEWLDHFLSKPWEEKELVERIKNG